MEWKEALLMAWMETVPPQPAAYYRRKATHARQVAEGATTQAVRARLLDEAIRNDQFAAEADRTEQAADFADATTLKKAPSELGSAPSFVRRPRIFP